MMGAGVGGGEQSSPGVKKPVGARIQNESCSGDYKPLVQGIIGYFRRLRAILSDH